METKEMIKKKIKLGLRGKLNSIVTILMIHFVSLLLLIGCGPKKKEPPKSCGNQCDTKPLPSDPGPKKEHPFEKMVKIEIQEMLCTWEVF